MRKPIESALEAFERVKANMKLSDIDAAKQLFGLVFYIRDELGDEAALQANKQVSRIAVTAIKIDPGLTVESAKEYNELIHKAWMFSAFAHGFLDSETATAHGLPLAF